MAWDNFPYLDSYPPGSGMADAHAYVPIFQAIPANAYYGLVQESSNILLNSFATLPAFPKGTMVVNGRTVYFLPPYPVTLSVSEDSGQQITVVPVGELPAYLSVNVDTLEQSSTTYQWGDSVPADAGSVDAAHAQAQADAAWRYLPMQRGMFCWQIPLDIWAGGFVANYPLEEFVGAGDAGKPTTISYVNVYGQLVYAAVPQPWAWVNDLLVAQSGPSLPAGFALGNLDATLVYNPTTQPPTLFDAWVGKGSNPLGLMILDTAFLGDTFVCLYAQSGFAPAGESNNIGPWCYGLNVWQCSDIQYPPSPPTPPPPSPLPTPVPSTCASVIDKFGFRHEIYTVPGFENTVSPPPNAPAPGLYYRKMGVGDTAYSGTPYLIVEFQSVPEATIADLQISIRDDGTLVVICSQEGVLYTACTSKDHGASWQAGTV